MVSIIRFGIIATSVYEISLNVCDSSEKIFCIHFMFTHPFQQVAFSPDKDKSEYYPRTLLHYLPPPTTPSPSPSPLPLVLCQWQVGLVPPTPPPPPPPTHTHKRGKKKKEREKKESLSFCILGTETEVHSTENPLDQIFLLPWIVPV